jgi:type IV secretory pathway TrbL component
MLSCLQLVDGINAWLIVVISFFIMVLQLFVSLIACKLTTLAGFVLVPFGLFGRTAFLSEKAGLSTRTPGRSRNDPVTPKI